MELFDAILGRLIMGVGFAIAAISIVGLLIKIFPGLRMRFESPWPQPPLARPPPPYQGEDDDR